LALACTCTSAAPALAGESATELELALAREPELYLKFNVDTDVIQVMVRGHELDRVQAQAVELVERRAPGHDEATPELGLPAVWRVTGAPEVQWRRVVAPPTLVPYQEDAEPPTPVPSATPPPDLPSQFDIELDNGWSLHLGPEPPGRFWERIGDRFESGWRRLTGRPVELPSPAIAVVVTAEDSRRLLHIFREGTPLLVVCGAETGPPPSSSAPPRAPSSGPSGTTSG
jgi:hypothetical protein